MRSAILVVDPAAPERASYRKALPADEFLLRFEATGERGMECAFAWKPALVLLELSLPGVGGLEVCRLIKSDPRTRSIPVCIVSSGCGRADIVAGLQAGADEVLAKPFHAVELLWRVRCLLRRFEAVRPADAAVLTAGPIRLDAEQGLCSVHGRPLPLTPKEFALLEALMRRPARVIKRAFLLETIWGFEASVGTRVVDLTLFRLRRKLGPEARRLETLPGFGYRLNGGSPAPRK